MILDVTGKLSQYEAIHLLFPAAAKFLNRPDLKELADGKYEIEGKDLFAIVMRAAGRSADEAKLEVHNDYIDIQVILQGTETMGWKDRATCLAPVAAFDSDKDLQFFDDRPDTWFQVQPGQFALFFPTDAHAPLVATEEIHKVVIKVAVTTEG